jgi:hypothetical protein
MPIIKGIKPSIAAKIVENAFRDVLGFDDEALASLSLNQKFSDYGNDGHVKQILTYVRTDNGGGVESLNPQRSIQIEALSGINDGSAIRLLVIRISDYAFYETN